MRNFRELADLAVLALYRLVQFGAIIFIGVVVVAGFLK